MNSVESPGPPSRGEIARLVFDVFVRPEPAPAIDDILTLYLFLPIVVWTIDGARVAYRSSLEALLADVRPPSARTTRVR